MANLYDKAGLVNIPVGYQEGFLYNIKPEDNTLAFRFNRDSAATLVNSKGLIEQVGYFGPELVKNGNFSELGAELVTNGDFATDSDWTKGTGWSISGGKANCDGSQTSQTTLESISNLALGVGNLFKITFDISNYSSGQIDLITLVGTGGPEITNINANGSYTAYSFGESTGNSKIQIIANSDFVGSIDNVSVKQVDPNDYWILGTGWSFGDGVALHTGSTGNLTTNASLTINKLYKVQFEIVSISDGVCNIYDIGSATTYASFTTTGLKSAYITKDSSSALAIRSNSSNATIDNVSVTEVLGDKPRIDYTDSLTSPSFLLEPQSTNLITYSEDFSSLNIRNNAVVTSNVIVSPSGLLDADEITFDGTSTGRVEQTISSIVGESYTISLYLKNKDLSDKTQVWIGFSAAAQGSYVTITDEWQRYDITTTADGTSEYPRIQFSGTGSLYAWGFQVEKLLYATSYIPTYGSAVTRAQETCNGAGNASTFNDSEGVLYCDIAALADDLTFRGIALSDGTSNNRVILRYRTTSNQINLFIRANSVLIINSTRTLTDITNYSKFALKYKSGDIALWVDGVEVKTHTNTFTLIGLDRLSFDVGNGSDDFYGKTKGVYVFNEVLTDDELQQLTGPEYNSFAALAAAYNYTVI